MTLVEDVFKTEMENIGKLCLELIFSDWFTAREIRSFSLAYLSLIDNKILIITNLCQVFLIQTSRQAWLLMM